MIPEIREKLELRIKEAEMKINNIFSKYRADEQMNIKDLEDVKRLSEIIKNLMEAYKASSTVM